MSYPAAVNQNFYSAMSFRQKGIAEAHIRAICASLGCSVAVPEPDDDKIDFTVASKVAGSFCNKPKLDIQSKCKIVDDPINSSNAQFSYTVDLDLYNNLRDTFVASPRILVVTLVPRDVSFWIDYSHISTKLSFCSYWVSLRGFPDLPPGQNSRTISIPTVNVFSASFLNEAFHCIANADTSFLSGEAF